MIQCLPDPLGECLEASALLDVVRAAAEVLRRVTYWLVSCLYPAELSQPAACCVDVLGCCSTAEAQILPVAVPQELCALNRISKYQGKYMQHVYA